MRPIPVVVAEARRVTTPTSRLTSELIFHLVEQVRLCAEFAAYARHRDDCELLLAGAVVGRDGLKKPLILRERQEQDPAAACTCGLSSLIARIPKLLDP